MPDSAAARIVPESVVPESVVPGSSAWAGWPRERAEQWAEALLGYERHRSTSTVTPMLMLVLWHDWRARRALPELECWVRLAERFEAHGVSADAFVRFHESAGVPRWSPAVDRQCRKTIERRRAKAAAALVAV